MPQAAKAPAADDTLCPVSHFLALALADNAFEVRGVNSVEDVLCIQVTAPRNSLHEMETPHVTWSSLSDIPSPQRGFGSLQIKLYPMIYSISIFNAWDAIRDLSTS